MSIDEPQGKGDSTVTLTHSRTKDLAEFTKNADIIITALGVPEF
jgi:methylenetetrahydrofolate dehydrogenase (NADP+)/methenyltetrahydrofolate cyclohydrolase